MKRHALIVASSLALTWSFGAGAQTSRFNDRVAPDTLGDAPGVEVWLEGPRTYGYGDPVRVRFSVQHDAYVMVARVDANGHLTVLYPANRSVSTLVSANREVLVRSRSAGSFASFYATDRAGGGYIFAMSSYEPFDLSRLSIRDFDRYVTGMYVGRPSRTYVGDPYRVVSRFASMVLFDQNTPFDYAVDYYNVDQPMYQSSVGYASLCNGYGRGYSGLQERWDDDLYYGSSSGGSLGCGGMQCYIGGLVSYSSFGFGIPSCNYGYNGQQVAHGPPVRPPSTPSTPRDSVRGPMVDSISGTRPDPIGAGTNSDPRKPLKPRVATDGNGVVVGGVRRAPLSGDDGDGGRVFSIPERALSNLRRRNAETLDPTSPLSGRPGSRAPSGGEAGVPWVRPPQEMTRGDGNAMERGNIPRPSRRDGRGDESYGGGSRSNPTDRPMPPRRDEGVRFSQPPRSDSPSRANPARFDSPPPSFHNSPQVRQESPRSQPVQREAPRAQVERPSPPPRPASPPPAAKEPANKKP